MSDLFEYKNVDKLFYEENLRDFLPEKMIDIHSHVWKKELIERSEENIKKTVSWPGLVAEDNSIEDLMTTYEIMFPGKTVTPLVFSTITEKVDELNAYAAECVQQANVPGLIFSTPEWSAEEFTQKVEAGGFLGAKCYLTYADPSIPVGDVTIFDFFPPHQLEVMNEKGWIAMIHIPRDLRLKDPKNLEQMLEIDEKYPNLNAVFAHVGRAYCNEDAGDAFEILKQTKNIRFDFSANTNAWIFEQLIKCVGPERVLFGSDMPILRMRMKRVTQDGHYVNLVPKGMYGDVSADPNMGELEGADAEALTFFMYEEIDAMRKAAEACNLSKNDVENIFYNNARQMIESAGYTFQE